jgi:hypothetical protein
VVLKSGRLLRGAFDVSASNLGLTAKVGFLYPHFFVNQWASPWWRRHDILVTGC